MNSSIAVAEIVRAGYPCLEAAPPTRVPGQHTFVLLHGAFADNESFRGWTAMLAERGHRAVAPLRRGRRGFGPDRAEGLTFDDYVTDTVAVLDTLDAPPVLVGHSLGALVAQRLAEQGRARALVLLAPAPPGALTAQPVALRHFAPLMPRIAAGRPFVVGPAACSALALNSMPAADRPEIHAHLTPESGKVYRDLMLGAVRVDAAKVTVPVLVLGGDEDRIISTRLLRKTAHHYGVRPRVLAGRGHWLMAEPGWQQLVDDVLAWLRERVPAAPDGGTSG